MPSNSRNELQRRLRDVDEIIAAHTAITGGGKGKPAQQQGSALTRAGVVLLSAAMEAFVEDLFEEAARLLMPGRSDDEMSSLFKNTSRRLNNANVHKTQMLFFNLGIPWALENIRWQKFSNQEFKNSINRLVEARNQVAHGKQPGLRLEMLRKWRGVVDKYSERLDAVIADYILKQTNTRPNW